MIVKAIRKIRSNSYIIRNLLVLVQVVENFLITALTIPWIKGSLL